MTKTEFVKAIASKYIFMEEVASTLYYALQERKHMILHGPGGHAKSEVVEYGLKLLLGEEDYYQKTFNAHGSKEMDVTPFLGYDNIPKFQREGVLEKILDDTIYLKKEYAIFEEGFDASDIVLTGMKDPLTRGYLCINGTCVPNTLKNLFICTNVSPKQWAGADRSRLALLQRFHFIAEVTWPAYTRKEFNQLFVVKGTPNKLVAEFCEICHQNGYPISPRSAVRMEELYRTYGMEALRHFEEIPVELLEKLKKFEDTVPFLKDLEECAQMLNELPNKSASEVIVGTYTLEHKLKEIKTLPTHGTYAAEMKDIVTGLRALRQEALKNPNAFPRRNKISL